MSFVRNVEVGQVYIAVLDVEPDGDEEDVAYAVCLEDLLDDEDVRERLREMAKESHYQTTVLGSNYHAAIEDLNTTIGSAFPNSTEEMVLVP